MFEFLILKFSLEFGLILQQDLFTYSGTGYQKITEYSIIKDVPEEYISLDVVAHAWDFVVITGKLDVTMGQTCVGFFYPHHIKSLLRVGLKLPGNLEIGAEHECDHPVYPYARANRNYEIGKPDFDSAHTSVYIRISGTLK